MDFLSRSETCSFINSLFVLLSFEFNPELLNVNTLFNFINSYQYVSPQITSKRQAADRVCNTQVTSYGTLWTLFIPAVFSVTILAEKKTETNGLLTIQYIIIQTLSFKSTTSYWLLRYFRLTLGAIGRTVFHFIWISWHRIIRLGHLCHVIYFLYFWPVWENPDRAVTGRLMVCVKLRGGRFESLLYLQIESECMNKYLVLKHTLIKPRKRLL